MFRIYAEPRANRLQIMLAVRFGELAGYLLRGSHEPVLLAELAGVHVTATTPETLH